MSERDRLRCPACGEPILRTDGQCLGCGAHLDEGQLAGSATGKTTPQEAATTEGDVLEVELEPETFPPGPPLSPTPARATDLPYPVAPGSPVWTVSDVTVGQGVWAALVRGWAFVRQSFALASQDFVVVVPSLLGSAAGLTLLGAFVLVLYMLRRVAPEQEFPVAAGDLLFNVFAAMVGLTALLVTYWFSGMTTDLVSAVLHRRRPSLAHAWNEACRNGLALVWLAVLTMAVNSLAQQARKSGGFAGGMAAEAVETGWRVAAYLLVPIVILEDIPLSQAFRRALHLHNNNIIAIIVGEVGVMWLTQTIGSLLFVGAAVGAFMVYQVAPVFLPMLIAGVAGVLVITGSFAGYVHMAYYTCLYEWAAAAEAAGVPVPAPLPLAAALKTT